MVLGIARLLCRGFALEVDGHDPASDSVAARRLSSPAVRRCRLQSALAAIEIGGSGKAPLFFAQLGRRLYFVGCARSFDASRREIGGNPLERRRDGRGELDRPYRDLCERALVLPLEDGGAAPSLPLLSATSDKWLRDRVCRY